MAGKEPLTTEEAELIAIRKAVVALSARIETLENELAAHRLATETE